MTRDQFAFDALFPLSPLRGAALLPGFATLVTSCSVSIVSLSIFLFWGRKMARVRSILALFFIPICLYLTQFLAKTAVQDDANYTFLHLDILALQARLVYPVLAIVLTILVCVKKGT